MISPHCTTSGFVTWEHSSFCVMWSRQLSVFPEDHYEQTLNPQLVGSGPTAGLCCNIQIFEEGWKTLRKAELKWQNHSRGTSSFLHLSVSLVTHHMLFSRILQCLIFALLDLMWHLCLELRWVIVGLHLNKPTLTTQTSYDAKIMYDKREHCVCF